MASKRKKGDCSSDEEDMASKQKKGDCSSKEEDMASKRKKGDCSSNEEDTASKRKKGDCSSNEEDTASKREKGDCSSNEEIAEMANQAQLEKHKFRNWVRAVVGLLYVKEGLELFCDHVVNQQHTDIINRVKPIQAVPTVNCGRCNLQNLKPKHAQDPPCPCPFGQANCNCQYPAEKMFACPYNVCGAIYDEIIELHAFRPPAPFWKNTDSQLWCANAWSIARCFINTPGYQNKLTVFETDCSGILHVLINNKGLHKHIQCKITGGDVFSQVRKDRNFILHSSNMELEDKEVDRIIDNMIAVLQDGKELNAREESQAAVKKLLELKKENIVIATSSDVQALYQVMEAIHLKEEEIVDTLNDEGTLSKEEQLMEKLQIWFKELEANNYIKEKKDYQTRLVNLYEENVVEVPVLPLQPGTNVEDIDTVYFKPWLGVETRQSEKGSSQSRQSTKTEMSMHEIFSNKGERLIYILGEAGSGKSTLCIYLVRQWCTAHASNKASNANESESDSEIVKAMKSFDFLFYITLRHNTGHDEIKQMLDQQYGDTILDKILESESNKCLILLDGLDEWTQDKQVSQFQSKGLPTRDHNKEYTIITTTRPWKFETLGIKDKEVHKRIRLKGLDKYYQEKMTTKFIQIFNQKFEKKKQMCDFKDRLENSPVFEICHAPLILQQFICLWFDDKLHETSVCTTYSSMLELYFDWAELKDEALSRMQNLTQDKENIHLPHYLSSSDICSKFKYIICCLAQLAFETLFSVNKENSLSFTDTIFKTLKIPKDVITCSLKTGILCRDHCVTLSASSRQKSIFSFSHKTIQEYLAAVHVAVEFENLSEMECQEKCKQCVEKYLSTCKTVADILQQSIVIIMLCGLQPELVTAISKYIYNITTSNKIYQEQDRYFPLVEYSVVKCIVRCIKEVRATEIPLQEKIVLSEITIDSEHKATLCEQTIDSQSVQYLRYHIPLTESFIKIRPQMNQLISLTVHEHQQMSGECCSTLTAFLEQATQLKQITVEIGCSDHDKHTLDLSQHEQFHYISFKVCGLAVECCCMSSAVKTSPQELNAMEVCVISERQVICLSVSSHALEFQYLKSTETKTNHLLMKFPAVKNINTLELEGLILSDSPSDMSSLKQITLDEVIMSMTTWKMFIDSLPTLPNSVKVKTYGLMIDIDDIEKNMSDEKIYNTIVNDKTEESVANFPVSEANEFLTVNDANKNLSVSGEIDDLNINEASDKLIDGRSNDELTKASTASEDLSSDSSSDDSSYLEWPIITEAKKYVKERVDLFSVEDGNGLIFSFTCINKGKSGSIPCDSASIKAGSDIHL